MPELPEVELGRKLAAGCAEGRRIVFVRCAADSIVFDGHPPEEVAAALTQRKVLAVKRRGKQIYWILDRPPHPLFHFGMTGSFHAPGVVPVALVSQPDPKADFPPRFAKIELRFDDGGALAMSDPRRLGRIRLRAEPEAEDPIASLGFDPLLDMPKLKEFRVALAGRRGAVKALLLDQSFAAGVGNWIADEVLYQAGIDPRRPVQELDAAEVLALHRALQRVVQDAVAVDADAERYPKTWLFHHRWGKKKGAQTADGHPIEHITVAGRTTAFVPAKQR